MILFKLAATLILVSLFVGWVAEALQDDPHECHFVQGGAGLGLLVGLACGVLGVLQLLWGL